MRRETIAPPAGMTPPAGWGPWVQDEDGAGGEVADASVEHGVPTRGTCACPICGLDLSSWTLPDRETHADACVSRALEGDATASLPAWGGRHDRPPFAETRAETTARKSPGDVGGGVCAAFLNRHGLARYAPAFAREALFPSDLISLTREDLRDVLGVRDERDAATFFAAVGGVERRPSRDDRETRLATSTAEVASSAELSREDARLASLEQHDDEWTRLAMAMSASMREAPPPTADVSSAPKPLNSATRENYSTRAFGDEANASERVKTQRHAPPSVCETRGETRGVSGTNARAVRVDEKDYEKDHEDADDARVVRRSVLEAARALGKRSVPSSLWGAAGHGGRDCVLPEWVLGGENPRPPRDARMDSS